MGGHGAPRARRGRSARPAALLTAAALGAALLAGCGSPPAVPVQADPVPDGGYPYLVQVRGGAVGYLCGGALIAPSWVLTAARCLAADLSVVIGRTALDETPGGAAGGAAGEVRGVAEARPYPTWTTAAVAFDVALLRLDAPATATPVQLADAAPPESVARAVGYSLVGGAGYAHRLGEVELRVRPDQELTAAYGTALDDPDAAAVLLGAGVPAGRRVFCAGDRGAPLLLVGGPRPRLAGVTSSERGCPPLARPGLFADVTDGPLRAWIEAQVRRPLGALVFADRPAEASYRPEVGRTSAGAPVTVTRQEVGGYRVELGGIGHGVTDGLAHVTPYGPGGASCRVAAQQATGGAQTVDVRCVSPNGQPADTAFGLSYARPVDTGPYAAVLVNADGPVQSTFNSTGGANTARRTGTGDYTVTLPGLPQAGATAALTPYGPAPVSCVATGVGPVRVRCVTPGGAPADSAFALTVTAGPPLAPLDGGSWAAATNDAATDAVRTDPGTYQVRLPGVSARGVLQVTSTGTRPLRCAPVDQVPDGAGLLLTVVCAGDGSFSVQYQS